MSKSKDQSPASKALSFEQLNQLTTELNREFADIELDFIRKSKFVTDRDKHVTEINELLCRLYEETEALKIKYENVARELLTNENSIQAISKIMLHLQVQTSSLPNSYILSEHAMMLNDVESLDAKISNTVNTMSDIKEILKNENLLPENIEKIIAILAEQTQTLLNYEKTLDKTIYKCEDIENLFRSFKENNENLK